MSESKEQEEQSVQENSQIDIFEFLSDFLRGFKKIWCILSHVDRTAENFVLSRMNIYSLW